MAGFVRQSGDGVKAERKEFLRRRLRAAVAVQRELKADPYAAEIMSLCCGGRGGAGLWGLAVAMGYRTAACAGELAGDSAGRNLGDDRGAEQAFRGLFAGAAGGWFTDGR